MTSSRSAQSSNGRRKVSDNMVDAHSAFEYACNGPLIEDKHTTSSGKFLSCSIDRY